MLGKKSNRFISFISLVSIIGIALGITVIIGVLSIMNGFKEEVRSKMLGMVAHHRVLSTSGVIERWEDLGSFLHEKEEIADIAPLVEIQGMIVAKGRIQGAYIRGVDPLLEGVVSSINKNMVSGGLDNLSEGTFGVVLGSTLASLLRVTVNDKITLVIPSRTVTPVGIIPRSKAFTVAGIFDSGFSEFDRFIALIDLGDAQKLVGLQKNQVNALRFNIADPFASPEVTMSLNAALPLGFTVVDWTQTHGSFFNALEMEKLILFVVLTLIIIIAAFNIISTMVMLIQEKRADIAILRTIGMLRTQVMKVFFIYGLFLGIIGTVLGVIGGILLASYIRPLAEFLERALQIQFLPEDVYPISAVPSLLLPSDVIIVASIALIMSLLATFYPSYHASKVLPAIVLREK